MILGIFICTGCGKEAKLIVPDQIEPTIEEIKKTNIETAKISFKNIEKTAELYYLESQLDVNYIPTRTVINFSDSSTIPENFVFSGSMPTSGLLIITIDGDIILSDIQINNLTCNYNEKNEIICQ